ncbi:unnamed protein product [Peronospora destructor]|uniref:ubiquitinyl hydrolase 1 n=1 Tax=Peronospora destructor TaxID=86335 RepID=A0AAV0U135_9STRA|nr:unnamed protein product [Peronospora destructor]
MGNMMGMGGSHAATDDASIKRYMDGYRRICRVESSGSSSNPPSSSLHGGSSSIVTSGIGTTNGLLVGKKLFRKKVLGAFTMIPHSLSDRLFDVLDIERSGELSPANVLRGLAWLKHGTFEEKVQLLFIIYDLEGAGEMSREVLDRFMDVIYGRMRARHRDTVKFLDRIFDGRLTMNFYEFRQIVQQKDERGDALLVKWLDVLAAKIGIEDDSRILELEKAYNPIVIRRRIAQATLFSLTEVTMLERQFKKMFDPKAGASTMNIEISVSIQDLVLFEEFCQFLSDFCRGVSIEEKVHHLFHIYSDRSTTMKVDLGAMKSLIHLVCGTNTFAWRGCRFQAAEAGWDEEAFAEWASRAVAVRRLLRQLAFAACILLGLKPESDYLEKRTVEWHWREATCCFDVGQTWNLLGAEWWRKWCDYVSLDPRTGSPYGSLPVPQIPAGTVVEAATNIRGNIGLRAASNGVIKSSCPPRPGPIINWSLLMQSGSRRLRQKLVLARDFYIIPSSVYAVLFSWYSGGPDLVRSIVEVPTSTEPELQIELFPLVLRVARVEAANGSVIRSGEEILLSELSTPASLLHATCRALLLLKLVDKARLWYFNEKSPEHKMRLREECPLELKKLTQDSVFLLEVQDDDGSWPLSQIDDPIISSVSNIGVRQRIQGSGRGSESDTEAATRKRQREYRPSLRTSDICSRGNLGEVLAQRGPGSDVGSPTTEVDTVLASSVVRRRFSKDSFNGPGLVGIDNLGNTCYMSSALQCLSHTRLLVEYFRNEAYLKDINLRNRDGTNGKLTAAFGELLRILWSSDRKRFAPNEFKKMLARCSPQFAGSDQHDSQELLACLLSSLSEDLNRVVKKPYTEQPDSDGRPDALVAEEWWQNHQKREFSVIVALFTGQYRSLLECSICRYESARFEPFTFLQLSLPESKSRSIMLTIIFRTDRVPLRFSVRVQNGDTVRQIKEQVAAFLTKTKNETLALDVEKDEANSTNEGNWTEVVIARTSDLHLVESLLDDKLPLTQIHEKDQLTAFQLDREEDLLSLQLVAGSSNASTTSIGSIVNQKNATGASKEAATKKISESPEGEEDAEHANEDYLNGTTPVGAKGGQSAAVDDQAVDVVDVRGDSDPDDENEVLLPLGASVYVRNEKTKDVVAARVIGSDVNSGTVNVAYLSGIRRYHIPLSKVVEHGQRDAFIFLVHRRVERSTDSFTNAHITRLFGAPLVIRISLRDTTTYNFYLLVWNRLRRIFNWRQPPLASDFEGEKHSRKRLQAGCTVVPLAAEETVAIDWDIRTLKEEYDPIQAGKMDCDASVQQHQRQDNQPLNLTHCMEMFTAKETIPEAYCGHCKTLRPATKKMDLWRLPPLLVIHLKRFCFTQVSRRKLHHLVDFPLRGLQFGEQGQQLSNLNLHMLLAQNKQDQDPHIGCRYRHWMLLPQQLLPVRGDDGFLYDLYAVVNHVGVLGGGHYFAYVLSDHDGKWKCFNDHQCKDIDEKEVVSPMAYILFYRRRDTTHMSIEHLFPPLSVDATENGAIADNVFDENKKTQVEELLGQSLAASGNASNCIIS